MPILYCEINIFFISSRQTEFFMLNSRHLSKIPIPGHF